MFNIGDTLYAARNILYGDIFGDGGVDLCYLQGTPAEIVRYEDYGASVGGDDFTGLRLVVHFKYGTGALMHDVWEFEDLRLFTGYDPR